MHREVVVSGSAYLDRVTRLLQAIRRDHPVLGVWEAADLQWWWRRERPTDDSPQIFWTDADGATIGAVIRTDWSGRLGLDVIVRPTSSQSTRKRLWDRAVDLVAVGTPIESMVDEKDDTASRALRAAGFVDTGDRGVSAWLDADDRLVVAPLAGGYRLVARSDLLRTTPSAAHHMESRNGPSVERRLGETSLYRPDLDLTVLDEGGETVAYGLFWFDPVTAAGLVEPMGTAEGHRRRGLARHVLTKGIERLAALGATRIKVNWDVANPASSALYLDCGFLPTMTTVMYVRSDRHHDL